MVLAAKAFKDPLYGLLPAALWPVSDRATRPTEGLPLSRAIGRERELAARIDVINDYLQWKHARTLALKMARSEASAERPERAAAERAASAAMTAAHLQIVGNHLEYLLRRRMLNLREAGRLVHNTVSNLAFSREMRRDYLMRLYALFPGLDPHLREGKHVMRANWKPRRFAPTAPKLEKHGEKHGGRQRVEQQFFWGN